MALSRTSLRTYEVEQALLVDNRNRHYLEGKAKYPATSVNGCILAFLSPFLLVGIFIIALTGKLWYDYTLLNFEGVSGWATYVDKYIDTDDGTTYYVRVSYTVSDRTYEHQFSVDSDYYQSLPNGEPISITYALSNPQVVTQGNASPNLAIGMTFFALLWNVAIWGIAYAMFRDWLWVRDVAKHGTLLAGDVLGVTDSTDSEGNYTISIRYTFQSPVTQQLIEGKISQLRGDKSHGAFVSGAPLIIAYLSDDKYRAL